MNNQSLWHIKNDYQALLSRLYDYETGEINQEIDAQLKELSDTAENKCIAIASWIKKIEAEKKQIEFMEDEIAKRKAAYEKEICKRLDYLQSSMEGCRISEIKCPYFTLRLKKNPYSTTIVDESQIPERFMRTREIIKTEVKADKTAIKEEVLKTGIPIPGAIVEQKTKLEILVDKL